MNPWGLFTWVLSIGIGIVLLALAVGIAIIIINQARKQK